MYTIKTIRKSSQLKTSWTGGITSQIAIYPETAEYSKRDFIWRLSTATVDLPESTFTSLPGFWRLLMVTDGEFVLKHEGHHQALLKQFDQDRFSGDWITRSYGKVSDLNLIMSAACKGTLTAIALSEDKTVVVPGLAHIEGSQNESVYYCVDGSARITVNDTDKYELHAGDALLISGQCSDRGFILSLNILGSKEAHIIRANMYF